MQKYATFKEALHMADAVMEDQSLSQTDRKFKIYDILELVSRSAYRECRNDVAQIWGIACAPTDSDSNK